MSVRAGTLPAEKNPEGSYKWSSHLVLKQNSPLFLHFPISSLPPLSPLNFFLSSSSLPSISSFWFRSLKEYFDLPVKVKDHIPGNRFLTSHYICRINLFSGKSPWKQDPELLCVSEKLPDLAAECPASEAGVFSHEVMCGLSWWLLKQYASMCIVAIRKCFFTRNKNLFLCNLHSFAWWEEHWAVRGVWKGRGAFDSWELDWELGLGIPRSWPGPQSQAMVFSASDVTRQKLSFLNFNHVHANLMFFALRTTYTFIYLKLFLK